MSKGDDPFSEIEELFDQFTEFGSTVSADIPVDVLDREEAVVVLADLPGRDGEEIQVRLEDKRTLHIEAPAPAGEPEGNYVVRGRPQADVSRSVQLPAGVDDSDTSASYNRGVLKVRLGKPSADSGTEIEVT